MRVVEVLLEADSRGRVAVGRLAGEHKRFLASVDDDGTITLKPAIVRSLIEDRLLADPAIPAAVNAAREPGHRVRDRRARRTAESS